MFGLTTSTYERCNSLTSLNFLLCVSTLLTITARQCRRHFLKASLSGSLTRSFARPKPQIQVTTCLRQVVFFTHSYAIYASIGDFYLEMRNASRVLLFKKISKSSPRISSRLILNIAMLFSTATKTIRTRRR